VAVFLLFWLFEFTGEIVEKKHLILEFDFWFYAAVITTIIYLILKVMKKKKLLD